MHVHTELLTFIKQCFVIELACQGVTLPNKENLDLRIASGFFQEIVQKIQQRMIQNAFKYNSPLHIE